MSSSQRIDPRRLFRLRTWTLRTRMITVVVALLLLLSLVIAASSVLFLRSFLNSQLDSGLRSAIMAATHVGPDHHGPGGGPIGGETPPIGLAGRCTSTTDPANPLIFPDLPTDSVSARQVDGVLVFGAQLTGNNCHELTADQLAAMNPGTLRRVPYTRQLGSLGSFRLIADIDQFGNVAIVGEPLSSVNDTVYAFTVIVAAVGAAGLLVAAVGGAAIVRRSLRPLRRVADTASRVAELELDRGDVALSVRVPDTETDPRTEIGQVGAALNRMLGHVSDALSARQASETRVRQFVADASHELRTPLAAIRGYAELARRGDDAVPPNVAHALRRVESESARMTVLVNDLLLLARLDSGRPLARDPVDLSRLVVDTVSDAHIAGPGHSWRLDLPSDPVTVTGDEVRLHQVLANLLSNARTHTPAGTTVTTALSEVDGHAILTVADDGPGIPPAILPEAFERFARADTSRSRNSGSTGLGLAIVAAVVTAHHGTVGVRSRPGNTVFTVHLPR